MHTQAKLQTYTSSRANLSTRVHYVRRSGHSIPNYCTGTSKHASPNTWTIVRSVHHLGCPCQMLRLSMLNTVRVQVQRAISSTWTIARSVHHPGCPCQMLRLSMPNTVRVALQVQRASPSTRTIARSVHHPGCPCQMRYGYKYSVRAHARGHERYIAQVVHAIKLYVYEYNVRAQTRGPEHNRYSCTCTSTACEPKHVGLSTIGADQYTSRAYEIDASPRLSMPKHCASGTSTVRTCKHEQSCILRTPPRLPMSYTVPRTHTRTHASGTTHGLHMPTAVHTYTYKIHYSGCPSRTPYRTYTRGKCSAQAPV